MTEMQQILEQSLEFYGGWGRWQEIQEIEVIHRAWGWALKLRGKPGTFKKYTKLRLYPEQPFVSLDPYPRKGKQGGFYRDKVWIEDQRGQVLSQRAHPRSYFGSFRRKFYWDDLDALYFGAYAMWNYLTQPFLLKHPDIKLQSLEPWEEDGGVLQRMMALFPPYFPTHCPKQIFYFDKEGRIVRHDYTAIAFGNWAKAAHYSLNFQNFDGFWFPTERRVYPRKANNLPLKLITLVGIQIKEVKIHKK